MLVALVIIAAWPTNSQAQGFHGIAVAKNCNSPVQVGAGYTCSYAISNTVDTGNGSPGSADTLRLLGVSDSITNTVPPVDSGPLLDAFTAPQITLLGGATCTASPGRMCTLPPGSVVIFGPETFYVVQPVDANHPTPIQDQLSIIWHDLCDAVPTPNNCNPDDQIATAPGSADVECGPCVAPNECTTSTCSAATGFVCVNAPVPTSTPCTDTDGNSCTNAGCEPDPNDETLGVCNQSHTFVPANTPCQDTDGNACTTAACDGAGICVQDQIFAPDSTPCQDADGNACTTAGCNGAGVCDQNHAIQQCPVDECNLGCDPGTGQCTPQPPSTPCTDTDGNECTNAGCELQSPVLGVCVQTHTFVPTSTPCQDTDGNACTTAGCEIGQCVQTHIECQPPGVTTKPNPSQGDVGAVLNDSATLTGGVNLTGTLTFELFDPSDSGCSGEPRYTQVVQVQGEGTYVTSPGFAADVVGTWRWTVIYSGDANNPGAVSQCSEPVIITGPVIPTLSDWGMVLMVGLLVGIGLVMMLRRRNVTAG
jgi:hypothetical protein